MVFLVLLSGADGAAGSRRNEQTVLDAMADLQQLRFPRGTGAPRATEPEAALGG